MIFGFVQILAYKIHFKYKFNKILFLKILIISNNHMFFNVDY